MLEYLGGSVVYSILKDIWSAILRRKRRLTSEQILELRQKWKKEFEPILWKKSQDEYGLDVVIRDMKRLDEYPEAKDTKRRRISAWFKVGLMATYHNGIEVGLRWEELVSDKGKWRLAKTDEKDYVKVILIGTIPYERIERVDWSGDNFYSDGHVYCHFTGPQRMPYDELFFAEEHQNRGGPKFYTKVASEEEVRKKSKEAGTYYVSRRKPMRLLERLGLSSKADPP